MGFGTVVFLVNGRNALAYLTPLVEDTRFGKDATSLLGAFTVAKSLIYGLAWPYAAYRVLSDYWACGLGRAPPESPAWRRFKRHTHPAWSLLLAQVLLYDSDFELAVRGMDGSEHE